MSMEHILRAAQAVAAANLHRVLPAFWDLRNGVLEETGDPAFSNAVTLEAATETLALVLAKVFSPDDEAAVAKGVLGSPLYADLCRSIYELAKRHASPGVSVALIEKPPRPPAPGGGARVS